jgi:hypothetical protein
LQTPPDGYTTSANVVQFEWENVPRAVSYRFQIATPDFNTPVSFLHDSLVSASSFSTSLQPGTYRWRVRGENPNSHTDYYERSLTITEAESLEGLTPVLLSPAEGTATAVEPLPFTWELLSGAEDYRFELRNGSQSGSLVNAQIVESGTLSLTGIGEGTYAWGVQGQNTTSTSLFSYRTLIVDRTAPAAPALISPSNSATLPQAPFTLQWQSGTDAATAVTDSLFILDEEEQFIVRIAAVSTSHEDSLGVGDYSWYVRSVDRAGNGTSSATRSFTVE